MELNERIPQDVKIDIAAKIISENYEDLETWDDLYRIIHSQIQYIYVLREKAEGKSLPNYPPRISRSISPGVDSPRI